MARFPAIWAGCSLTASSSFYPSVATRLRGLALEPHIARLTLNFFDGSSDEELCASRGVSVSKVG